VAGKLIIAGAETVANTRVVPAPFVPDVSVPSVPAPKPESAGGISSTPFPGSEMTKTLPGTIVDALMAGGGRFLVLHLDSLRKAAVFDVNTARIKYLALRATGARLQAGRSKLVAYYKQDNVIERWDLLTGKKELTTVAPNGADSLVIGSDAEFGFILGGAPQRLNLKTMRTESLELMDGRYQSYIRDQGLCAASPDGSVYAMWRVGTSPSGLTRLTIIGDKVEGRYEHDSVGVILPTNEKLYTCRGIFNTSLADYARGSSRNDAAIGVPAHGGEYYVRISNVPQHDTREGDQPPVMDICLSGSDRVIVRVGPLPEVSFNRWGREAFHYGKRIHFVPAANVLILIPNERNKIILKRLDLLKELEKSDIDYLFVDAKPLSSASPGVSYQSRVGVRSRAGGVSYRLDSAPGGMALSADGTLTWTSPTKGAHSIIITISDTTGQELFYTFDLHVD
jgi:hypothetical protein